MNRTLIAAIAFVAASSAFAESPLAGGDTQFTGSRSRADVQAELQQYKAAGVNPWSQSYNPLRAFHSTRTRAQASAEYLQSRDEVAALNGEDSGSSWLAAQARRSAPPVLAGAAPLAR